MFRVNWRATLFRQVWVCFLSVNILQNFLQRGPRRSHKYTTNFLWTSVYCLGVYYHPLCTPLCIEACDIFTVCWMVGMEQRTSECEQAGTVGLDTVGSYSGLHPVIYFLLQEPARSALLIMATLSNKAGHYILPCGFFLSIFLFYPRLISAAADRMSTILPRMVWP